MRVDEGKLTSEKKGRLELLVLKRESQRSDRVRESVPRRLSRSRFRRASSRRGNVPFPGSSRPPDFARTEGDLSRVSYVLRVSYVCAVRPRGLSARERVARGGSSRNAKGSVRMRVLYYIRGRKKEKEGKKRGAPIRRMLYRV